MCFENEEEDQDAKIEVSILAKKHEKNNTCLNCGEKCVEKYCDIYCKCDYKLNGEL